MFLAVEEQFTVSLAIVKVPNNGRGTTIIWYEQRTNNSVLSLSIYSLLIGIQESSNDRKFPAVMSNLLSTWKLQSPVIISEPGLVAYDSKRRLNLSMKMLTLKLFELDGHL